MWIIAHAADRAPMVDQAVSNNLFFPPDVDKADLLSAHWSAWESGVKSLYYCRSKSLKTAHAVSQKVERKRIIEEDKVVPLEIKSDEAPGEQEEDFYFECEACQ